MDIQHAFAVAGEALTALAALATFLGTVRNGLTHLGWISPAEATKFGKVLDRLSWVAEKGSATLKTLPGVASKPALAPVPPRADGGFIRTETMLVSVGVTAVFWVLIIALMSLCGPGCATTSLPANATPAQKLVADVAAVATMRADILAQCPKMAPIANLISKAVAIASTPADILSDIEEAVSAVPDLVQDYDSVACAIKVVIADYKKFFKAQPANSPAAKTALQKISLLEGALQLLQEPGSLQLQCASPSSR